MGGRSILFCEYDKDYNPHFVDDNAAVCCEYLPNQLQLLTPCGNKIKVWNALNGEILKIFSEVTKGDITAFTLDELKRRCFIGDTLGEVNVYNVLNGA